MDNNSIYFILLVIATLLVVVVVAKNKSEGLSLSQFPTPTCSNRSLGQFYTCGPCGTIYQKQNKLGQACDCGGFNVYRTAEQPSCYTQSLKGEPTVTESFRLQSKGSCKSCSNDDYTCLEAAGTFDSGSTFLRNLPCPVPFPPVVPGYEPIAQKQSRFMSELDVFNHLENEGLIIGANDGKIVDYAMKKLMEATAAGGDKGYPNFYYINGPVLIMSKVGKNYFWMIDYPIKYNPENFANYVNTSTNWNIAKTAYHAGRKLLNPDEPIIFFAADPRVQFKARAAAFACLPETPQLTTQPKCASGDCVWGPKYGSGNWLTRV